MFKKQKLCLANTLASASILFGLTTGIYLGSFSAGLTETLKGFSRALITWSSLRRLRVLSFVAFVAGGCADLFVCYKLTERWFPSFNENQHLLITVLYSFCTFWWLTWGVSFIKKEDV